MEIAEAELEPAPAPEEPPPAEDAHADQLGLF